MNYTSTKKDFKSADGKNISSVEYKPANKAHSAIILVYEIFGITNHIKNLAIKISENGFIVNIPDIFSRLEENVSLPYNKQGFEKGISLKEKIGWQIPVMDIVASASIYKQQNYEVYVLGFCFGGSLAWLSMQKSFIFDKGVCYYGSSIPDFLDFNINCPSMLHFGNEDKGIPPNAIKKIKDYANKQLHEIDIYEYPNADHGFNCEDRKSYSKIASQLAYERTIKFLRKEK